LIVAFVPTGIKTGVRMVIPLRVSSPTLARHCCARTRKDTLDHCNEGAPQLSDDVSDKGFEKEHIKLLH
jgi:hypothetical protein